LRRVHRGSLVSVASGGGKGTGSFPTASAMRANDDTASRNASLRATKSVSVLTSTIAPVAPRTATPTSPWTATRLAFLSAFSSSASRSRSTAASKSPAVAASAFLHAITPAPVFSRSVFTSVALIPAIFVATLRLQIRVDELQERRRRAETARQDHFQPRALRIEDRVDAQRRVRIRSAFRAGHQRGRDPARRFAVDRVDLDDARNLDVLAARGGSGPGRFGLPGQRLEALARDAVLLSDSHRLEPAVADVAPHRPDVKTEPLGYLIYRIQLIHQAVYYLKLPYYPNNSRISGTPLY